VLAEDDTGDFRVLFRREEDEPAMVAQVISIQGRQAARGSGLDLRDHGWFVFFAPKENPEIAGVIFGEHNEHGYLGAPIAKHVIETYFAKKEGRPLPVLAPKPAPAPPEADPDTAPVELRPPVARRPNPNSQNPTPNVGG